MMFPILLIVKIYIEGIIDYLEKLLLYSYLPIVNSVTELVCIELML